MSIDQPEHRLYTVLVARPLALCRRVLEAIARRTQMGLQRLAGHTPRLEPTRLPVLGAKLRTGTTPKPTPTQGEHAESIPLMVRDRALRLVRPGHADFGNAVPETQAKARSDPQPPSKPQPEPAPGETQMAPNAETKR
jgi:hypothetical protein